MPTQKVQISKHVLKTQMMSELRRFGVHWTCALSVLEKKTNPKKTIACYNKEEIILALEVYKHFIS